MRHPKIEPYFSDYVETQLKEIAKYSAKFECVRTEYVPEHPNPKNPDRTFPSRKVGVIECDHGRQFMLILSKSNALDQTQKLADFLQDAEAVEAIRGHLALIAGCNVQGAWPISALSSMPDCVVGAAHPPELASQSSVQYLQDAIEDLHDMLPGTRRIEIRYLVTHASNHVQRTRPFYIFHNAQREIAAIEAAQLQLILRHEMGAPRTLDHFEKNESRIGLYCQQLSLRREDVVPLGHLLPLFGSNFQATEIKLR